MYTIHVRHQLKRRQSVKEYCEHVAKRQALLRLADDSEI